MGKTIVILVFLFVAIASIFGEPSSQYLATIHHSSESYRANKRSRSVNSEQFIGDLVFNNTINENGEITISLCDITKDLFGDVPSFEVFDITKNANIGKIVEAEVSAKLRVNVQVDGCLVFFFNPCCETVGVRFELDNPVVLSAVAGIEAKIEAFNTFGIGAGSEDIKIDPLNGINLGGFSPVIGSWGLPPILDQFTSIKMTSESFCAQLGLPGTNIGLRFCVELRNFTAGLHRVRSCPRLTIYFGDRKLLDLSYTSVAGGPECLELGFAPVCPMGTGTVVAPDIVQLFKSIDVNGDFKVAVEELDKSKALLGIFNTKDANIASFAEMDGNRDGRVDFTEFRTYTKSQTDTYNQNLNKPDAQEEEEPKTKQPRKFSGGDVALAVVMTMLGTTLIVGAVLLGVAQYKGIVKVGWLGKVIPTKV